MNKLIAACAFLAALTSYTAFSIDYTKDADPDFDRLDGAGPSGKKVDVVEWEGNLEVHVYPKGSLKGLALTVDRKNKEKPVMVIGYRFDNAPKKQLIRRAILSVDLKDSFKTFRDPSAEDYDKIVISNNVLSNQMVAYQTEVAPAQLYPDGHPALEQANEQTQLARVPKEKGEGGREPASAKPAKAVKPLNYNLEHGEPVDEYGGLKPFTFK